MADQNPNPSSTYTPRSSQAAPHYTAGSMPESPDRMDCSFDDIAAWDEPLDRLPVEQPVSPSGPDRPEPFRAKTHTAGSGENKA